jgi:hypothetical protein
VIGALDRLTTKPPAPCRHDTVAGRRQ